jgi:hypothetical protein
MNDSEKIQKLRELQAKTQINFRDAMMIKDNMLFLKEAQKAYRDFFREFERIMSLR